MPCSAVSNPVILRKDISMKKTAVLLCAAILTASLAGCGITENEQTPVSVSSTVSSQAESSYEESSDESSGTVSSAAEISEESKAEESTEEKSVPAVDKTKLIESYRNVVEGLVKEHGQAAIIDDRSTARGNISGVSVVRLIDFNNDGIDELLCAYSSTGTPLSDTLQVYSFIEGRAVSVLLSSLIKNGADHYVEYFSTPDKTYLTTDGNIPAEFDGREFKTANIKNNGSSATHLSIKNTSDGENIVNDTLETMKTLGCTVSGPAQRVNIKETEGYKTAAAIYDNYIKTGQWASYEFEGQTFTDDALTVSSSPVFDYNDDGVFEMLLTTDFGAGVSVYNHRLSYLFTIENGQVKPLLQCPTIADDTGGSSAEILYSENDDRVYISNTESLYSINSDDRTQSIHRSVTFYELTDNLELEQVRNILSESVNSFADGSTVNTYLIDNNFVKQSEYDKINKHIHPIKAEVIDRFYNEYSDKSNIDRLKEMDGFLY